MDSFQFWLYVIIGVIYLVSRMLKKQPNQPGELPDRGGKKQTERANQPTKSAIPKRLSFEDLLREITEGKTITKQEPVVDYDDSLGDEERSLEDVGHDYRKDNKTYETYEAAKKQAFFRPSLEETMKVGDTVVNFGKFKEFEKDAGVNVAAEYLKDFKDIQSIRRAVVLTEILKRKF